MNELERKWGATVRTATRFDPRMKVNLFGNGRIGIWIDFIVLSPGQFAMADVVERDLKEARDASYKILVQLRRLLVKHLDATGLRTHVWTGVKTDMGLVVEETLEPKVDASYPDSALRTAFESWERLLDVRLQIL